MCECITTYAVSLYQKSIIYILLVIVSLLYFIDVGEYIGLPNVDNIDKVMHWSVKQSQIQYQHQKMQDKSE